MSEGIYTPPTLLDRLISQISPRTGLRRHWERQLLTRAYEAASPRDTWKPRRAGASANADHQADAGVMRAKARSLVQNVPYMRAALDALVANVVGTGIVPVPQGPQAEAALALWRQWAPVADADGRRDIYGLQSMAYRALEQDGEVLLRWRPRREQDGLPVPLQVQLLEIDYLDTSRRQQGGAQTNSIVDGIEQDFLGRVVAYWLWDQHPGDTTIGRRNRTQSVRVPATLVTHLFRPERPGQGRGFTRFASVINSARDLRLLQDAELQRRNLETRLGVIVSGDASLMAGPPTTLTADQAKQTGSLGELPSGAIVNVPPGSNVTTVSPNASPGYVDHVKLELHLMLAAIGVPFEEATGIMTDVNFSSARVRQLQFRRQCEQIQWLDLVPGMCAPTWAKFVEAARMVDKLKRGTDVPAEHTCPKWDYVNPQQEVNASVTEVGAGMQSISEHIRRRGYDPAKVFAELKSDITQLKDIGIFDSLMFVLKGQSPDSSKSSTSSSTNKE